MYCPTGNTQLCELRRALAIAKKYTIAFVDVVLHCIWTDFKTNDIFVINFTMNGDSGQNQFGHNPLSLDTWSDMHVPQIKVGCPCIENSEPS